MEESIRKLQVLKHSMEYDFWNQKDYTRGYNLQKKLRKRGYRTQYYAHLTDEEKIDKLQNEVKILRRKQFKVRCSQYCFDFFCSKCVALRKAFDGEITEKEEMILAIVNAPA